MPRIAVACLLSLVVLVATLAATFASARELVLGPQDLRRLGSGPIIAPSVQAPPRDPSLPVVDPADGDDAGKLLQRLVTRGVSQGFGGILYENRDWGHSSLPETLFPNLTFLKYEEALHKQRLDYGLADDVLIPALVFGNSSTAQKYGLTARSLSRISMTRLGGAARAYRNYSSNSIYIYPEHKDHDATDLYPASWPYQIISQGSSYSDGPFMKAVAMTIAAFPEETRQVLERENLIAPTVQMILRRNLSLVRSRDSYLSGLAHPTVFSSEWLETSRMVAQAAALQPQDIPPMVRLRVVEDDFRRQAGLAGLDEHLFTTPSAIARIWRDTAWQRQITLSAAPTKDPNGHNLTFEWVILRGDPDRVRIETLDPKGRSARITLNWHDAFAVPTRNRKGDKLRASSRVDIGVFAFNGRAESAPAIVSVSFPTHQLRTYEAGPDGALRIASIDYDAPRNGRGFDPVLHWYAEWTDLFRYSDSGELLGLTRRRVTGVETHSDEELASDGRKLSYEIVRPDDALPFLTTGSGSADP